MIFRLLLLSLSFLFSLLIFQSGFLLKRQELHINSTCLDAKLENSTCWMPKQHDKIVLLIVDALRYDFLVPQKTKSSHHYLGQMSTVSRLIDEGAVIGTVLADPPTTTLQRLKALTTGTLPTFIDAGNNFSPDAAIEEDNWVSQAQRNGRKVVFYGDDTWLSLYPTSFYKAEGFSSFNINDLYSVDENVRRLLKEELSKDEADLIIAHVLGVDHCGHKFGPSHPEMGSVLRRMDDIIRETADQLEPSDLLIVLGDHGMTSTGDHGGDSFEETHAGVLLYQPGRRLSLPDTSISQIDIVPTLSMLLGLPIPFSNLGITISSVFKPDLRDEAVRLNYDQMQRFANAYASTNILSELLSLLSREASSSDEQMLAMTRIQNVLRAAWTQFDWPLMRTGLMSLVESVLFAISMRKMNHSTVIIRSGCLLLQLAVMLKGTEESPAVPLLMVILPLSIAYSIASLVATLLTLHSSSFAKTFAFVACVVHSLLFTSNSFVVYEGEVVRFILQSVITVAAIQSLHNEYSNNRKVFKGFKTLLSSSTVFYLFLSLALCRLERVFHRCREEEKECDMHFPVQLLGLLSADMQIVRLLVCIATIAFCNWWILRRFWSESDSQALQVAWILSRPASLFIVLYQMSLVALSKGTSEKLQYASMVLAQLVYFVAFTASWLAIYSRRSSESKYLFCLAYALSWPFFLLLGDGLSPSLVVFISLTSCVFQLTNQDVLPLLSSLLIPSGYYLTGHSPTLAAIPWQAAFVGLPGNFPVQVVPAILVLSHICISSLFVAFLLTIHPKTSSSSILSLVAVSSIRVLSVSFTAFLHRRHLMVWKIFAPKFIFESVAFIYLLVVTNICLITCRRRLNLVKH